ncbi:MAG: hypothetical protein HQ564_04400 [Candidatus Saganbacteria bacterium]|nr:hypothetical protein [Candidatus Saganbacteria bacterium]
MKKIVYAKPKLIGFMASYLMGYCTAGTGAVSSECSNGTSVTDSGCNSGGSARVGCGAGTGGNDDVAGDSTCAATGLEAGRDCREGTTAGVYCGNGTTAA